MKAAKDRGLMPSTGLGAGILAAALLSLLTLSVFYVLQDYGPESAIRKYNQAVLAGDVTEVDRVSSQPHDSAGGGQILYESVGRILSAGGRLRLLGMDRHPSYVTAQVEYVLPQGYPVNVTLVVTKENHIWKVNPDLTYKVFKRLAGQQS